MLVSIIIPNYNHGSFLKQRIDSVLKQTYDNIEVVILDDCSTDNSCKIIEEYRAHPKVKSINYNRSNSGSPFAQWQRGLALIKGVYVWIAESDDWSESSFLERTVAILEAQKEVGFVFCGNHWINENGDIGKDLCVHQKSFVKDGKDEVKKYLVKVNTIQNVSSVLFRKQVFDNISNSYLQYKACGDWMLYTEILCSYRFAFLEDKLNYFRFYHNNTSHKSSLQGLWQVEGVDVLAIAKRRIEFTRKEKEDIMAYWGKMIRPLRRSIPLPLKQYVQIHRKLFTFSPAAYIRYVLPHFALK